MKLHDLIRTYEKAKITITKGHLNYNKKKKLDKIAVFSFIIFPLVLGFILISQPVITADYFLAVIIIGSILTIIAAEYSNSIYIEDFIYKRNLYNVIDGWMPTDYSESLTNRLIEEVDLKVKEYEKDRYLIIGIAGAMGIAFWQSLSHFIIEDHILILLIFIILASLVLPIMYKLVYFYKELATPEYRNLKELSRYLREYRISKLYEDSYSKSINKS
ncbi:hypothetical protein [Alkalibacillus salilacus]|uniref:ABC transporter ATP-binding protein n=1 Tax=Alkalibacillus salilacus TaxID=284582 RepID=A0ABT9VIT3_9BACI|nr:hypothetical protein [Alkalibacillus salilacus]MDQ0160863.1 hypothetical protein [Alkalibacillus salilacus]